MLEGGTLRPAAGPLPSDTRRAMSGTLEYLLRTHGPGSVAGRFPNAATLRPANDVDPRDDARLAARTLLAGVNVAYTADGEPGTDRFALTSDEHATSVRIDGMNRAVTGASLPIEVSDGEVAWTMRLAGESPEVTLERAGVVVAAVSLAALREEAVRRRGSGDRRIPENLRELRDDSEPVRFLVRVIAVSGRFDEDAPVIEHLTGDFYWSSTAEPAPGDDRE
jgi:hypothetical protein